MLCCTRWPQLRNLFLLRSPVAGAWAARLVRALLGGQHLLLHISESQLETDLLVRPSAGCSICGL